MLLILLAAIKQSTLVARTIDAVSNLGIVAMGLLAFYKAAQEYFKFRLDREKEQSAGKTAVDVIKKDLEEIKSEIRNNKIDNKHLAEIIDKLDRDYTFIVENLLQGAIKGHNRRNIR